MGFLLGRVKSLLNGRLSGSRVLDFALALLGAGRVIAVGYFAGLLESRAKLGHELDGGDEV